MLQNRVSSVASSNLTGAKHSERSRFGDLFSSRCKVFRVEHVVEAQKRMRALNFLCIVAFIFKSLLSFELSTSGTSHGIDFP